jgi:hypothetical protein
VKLMKILGLAAVAALAVMAFANTASARVHPLIKFCKEQVLLLCPNTKSVNTGGVNLIGTQVGVGKLEGTINQSCTGGTIEGETGAMEDQADPSTTSKLLGKTTKLTFTGCEPCKKITTSPPFVTNLVMSGEEGGWTLEGAGNAKFQECTFGVECKFEATELKPAPIVEMSATEAWVNTNKAVLTRTEGSAFLCGNTGQWNAKYKLTLSGANIWPTLCAVIAAAEKCVN